jgi:hypothetical protein
LKADGAWRHDFTPRLFTVFRPVVEWNRQFRNNGVPADYVSLQQELGAGITVVGSDTRKLRLGLSHNLFDLWNTVAATHTSRGIGSAFAEVEAKLPWRMTLTERAVWYYPLGRQRDGWENRFDLDKKLTQTLTVGVHHEVRHNNPNVAMADFSMTRLMLGFDF